MDNTEQVIVVKQKRTGAIAGVIAGVLALLGILSVGIIFSGAESQSASSGAIVEENSLDAFTIRVGDCFNDTSTLVSGEVSSLPGVSCSDPHDNEAYAVFDVDIASFPGDEKLREMAFDACQERFASFVGRDYDSSALDIMTVYPDMYGWHSHNDRQVVCAVYDMNGGKLTETAGGSSI